jgi:hypothetical protein
MPLTKDNSTGSTMYHVSNITSNLQKFVTHPQNETVQFNLNETHLFIYPDKPVFFFI